MNTSIKCLITGGAGFIGSHLCDALINIGYEVYCVDNLITGSKENISHLLDNPQFHFIKHDIIDPFPPNFKFQISNFKFLYHLASPASPPQYRKYSLETMLVNSLGTYNMLELAKETEAVFLLASTSEVYGNPLIHPQKENYYGNVNPIGSRSCYDESKRFAESITMEYVRKHKLHGRIVRIFNTYGPRMLSSDGRVVSNFITQAIGGEPLTMYGDGSQTRSFCYISDMVSGLVAMMEKKGIDGEVINLGNPEELTIKQIGEIILDLTGSKSLLVSVKNKEIDDPDRRKPDISKANKILSWQPKIPLKEGLLKTIRYFREKR